MPPPQDESGLSPLFTVKDVARAMRVSERTVWDWVRDGALEALKVGGNVRVRQTDYEEFLCGHPYRQER